MGGGTAVAALKYFRGEEIVAVTSMYGFRKPGRRSIKPEYYTKLVEAGAHIIFQTHAFAGIDRSIN